jgi:hypothetical protein
MSDLLVGNVRKFAHMGLGTACMWDTPHWDPSTAADYYTHTDTHAMSTAAPPTPQTGLR